MVDGDVDPPTTVPHAELEHLLTSVSDVVWMASADGREMRYVNSKVCEVYGRDSSEFLQDPSLWLAVVHPDDRATAEGSIRQLSETGDASVEYRIIRPNGEVRWISDRKVRVSDAASGRPFVGGIARDITERKRSEQLAEVQQCILQGIATCDDPADVLVRICEEVERFVPGAVATILLLDDQCRLRVAAAPSCPAEVIEAFDGLVPGKNVGSCGTSAYTAERCIVVDTATDERWADLREAAERFGIRACWSIPILSKGKRVLGTFAISSFAPRSPSAWHERLLDAASRMAAICIQSDRDRRALTAAVETAEAAARSKGELLANVSHELRTPMSAILGFSQMLLEDESVAERHRRDLRLIRDSGSHLLELINNLLDLSKIDAGCMEPEHLPCSPKQVLEEALALFESTIGSKGLRLLIVGPEALPPWIVSDPTRLRQILVNLVSNAVKFTESGGITIRCSCESLDGGRVRLEIAVVDTGVGVPADQAERIFAPFGQADSSTTRRFGGTGLGLTVSRQLARMLGGDIAMSSELGCGSTFSLRFVATLLAESTGSSGDLPEPGQGSESFASRSARLRCRVLLAEDTPLVQLLIQSVLERAGADVVVVADGESACRTAIDAEAGTPFDLVLMDMHMPVMDGYSAVRTLRDRGFSRPVIALTARAQPDDRDRCLGAGCDAYLTKPLDGAKLVELIADLTG